MNYLMFLMNLPDLDHFPHSLYQFRRKIPTMYFKEWRLFSSSEKLKLVCSLEVINQIKPDLKYTNESLKKYKSLLIGISIK